MMVAGGGHPTHQWFGMYYADQVGKRLPVPIFQAMEDLTIFGILLLVERWLRNVAPQPVDAPLLAVGNGVAVADSVQVDAVDALDGEGEGADDHSGDGADVCEAVTAGDGAGVGPDGRPVPLPPAGIVIGVGMVLWGIERFLDEHLWLGEDGHLGSLLVQFAGVALAVAGIILLITRIGPLQRWRRGEDVEPGARYDLDGRSEVESSSEAESSSEPVASTPGPATSVGD